MCLSEADRGFIKHHDDEILSQWTALDGEGLNLAVARSAQREFETLLYSVYRQHVPVDGITSLSEYKRGEILRPSKLWRSCCRMLK